MKHTLRPSLHLHLISGCLLYLLFLLPVVAQAPPSGDTFVSSSFGKTNFGSNISLVVQPGATTFIQFNLSGIPAGATVSKATLRLYADAVVKSGTFDVYQVNGSWGENTVTFNTAPGLGTSATGGHPISITSASCNQFLLVDITSLVQGWVNGGTNNGVALALTSGSQGSFSFDSKESLLTGNGPELEIALGGAVGPQGPQGIQGPPGPQGAQGPQGLKGASGATGAQGPKGDTGTNGPQGLRGDTGPQGIAGPSGTSGYANFSCPSGQSMTGFDAASQPICSGNTGGSGGGQPDYDGDGIPDAVDPCPYTPNVVVNGGSYCPATIYDILEGIFSPGAAVGLSNVWVTNVSGSLMTVQILPGDPDYNGNDQVNPILTMDLGSLPPPTLGSQVNVYGMVLPGAGCAPAAIIIVYSP